MEQAYGRESNRAVIASVRAREEAELNFRATVGAWWSYRLPQSSASPRPSGGVQREAAPCQEVPSEEDNLIGVAFEHRPGRARSLVCG